MNLAERLNKKLREVWDRARVGANYLAIQNRRSELRAVLRDEDVYGVDFDEVIAVARGESAFVEVGGELEVHALLDPEIAPYDDLDPWPLASETGGEA